MTALPLSHSHLEVCAVSCGSAFRLISFLDYCMFCFIYLCDTSTKQTSVHLFMQISQFNGLYMIKKQSHLHLVHLKHTKGFAIPWARGGWEPRKQWSSQQDPAWAYVSPDPWHSLRCGPTGADSSTHTNTKKVFSIWQSTFEYQLCNWSNLIHNFLVCNVLLPLRHDKISNDSSITNVQEVTT